MSPWSYLLASVLFEIIGVIALKSTAGFTKLAPSISCILNISGSIVLLGMALRSLPMGSSIAIWTGVGVTTVAVVGIVFFQEPARPLDLLSMALVVSGCIGLALTL